MSNTVSIFGEGGDLVLIKLAREIVINHYDTETILKRYGITAEVWALLEKSDRFGKLLRSETEAWESAANTSERTRLKASALIEEFLPEANARLHDGDFNPMAKVQLAKLIAGIAGLGVGPEGVQDGSKLTISINLGADHQLKIEKQLPGEVIEAGVAI